jgi:hypothetical protein
VKSAESKVYGAEARSGRTEDVCRWIDGKLWDSLGLVWKSEKKGEEETGKRMLKIADVWVLSRRQASRAPGRFWSKSSEETERGNGMCLQDFKRRGVSGLANVSGKMVSCELQKTH